MNSVSNKIADLETFINDNKDTLNTTLFTTVLDMMRSIENQINLRMKLRSGTGRVPTLWNDIFILFLDCSSYNVMVTLKEITDNIGAVLTEMLNSADITSSTTVTNFVTSLQSFITELSNYYAQQISSISGACSTSSAAPTSTAQPSTSTAGSTSTAQTSTSTTGSTSTAQPSTSTAGSSSTAQPSTLTAGSTSTAVLIK